METPDFSSYFHKVNECLDEKSSFKETFTNNNARYGEREIIGEGGQKTIYKAYDSFTGRTVALAFLKGEYEDYFFRESRITAYLQHPYILPIYDSGLWENGESFYLGA